MDFVMQRFYRGTLKGVLLNWAGTTLDYGCLAPALVFVDVFKRKGVDISMEESRLPMGAHKKVHIRKITQIPAVAKRWESVHKIPVCEDDVEAMFEDFVPLQVACLSKYADLIPGTNEAVLAFRDMGLKIGSTTGFTSQMMETLLVEAKKRGYTPDSAVCATDVPAGRPEPWMCLKNAMNLRIFPMEAIVKVGDTLPDIEEGLNAGMWTIGLAKTGNEMGLCEKDVNALPPAEYMYRIEKAYQRFHSAGAHYVVDSISDVPPLIEKINIRLRAGERP